MTWEVKALAATSAVLLVSLVAALPRRTPAPLVREHQAEAATSSAAIATLAAATSSSSSELERHVTTTRTDSRPSGRRVVTVREEIIGERAATSSATLEATSASSTATARSERDRAEEPAPMPPPNRWRLAVAAEWSTLELRAAPTVRLELARRVAGPIWLYVSGAPPVLGQRAELRAGARLEVAF